MAKKQTREEELNEVRALYMQNPYWRGQYENAPSEECKAMVEYLWFNLCGHTAEERKENDDVEARMTKTDWMYMYKYAGRNPFSTYCKKMAAKAEAEGRIG